MAPTPGLNSNARQGGFNSFAAGDKLYGGGRTFPNVGPTSDPAGYKERNLTIKSRQNAILRRMKMDKKKDYANPLSQPKNQPVSPLQTMNMNEASY